MSDLSSEPKTTVLFGHRLAHNSAAQVCARRHPRALRRPCYAEQHVRVARGFVVLCCPRAVPEGRLVVAGDRCVGVLVPHGPRVVLLDARSSHGCNRARNILPTTNFNGVAVAA